MSGTTEETRIARAGDFSSEVITITSDVDILDNDELQAAIDAAGRVYNSSTSIHDTRIRDAALRHYRRLCSIQEARAKLIADLTA